MAVDKTVDTCRKNARTDLVRSVLASTSFQDPKEVIAKFLTETTLSSEHQVMHYEKFNNYRGNSNNRGSYRGRNRGRYKNNYNFSNSNQNNYNYNNKNGRGQWSKKRNSQNRNAYMNTFGTENSEAPPAIQLEGPQNH